MECFLGKWYVNWTWVLSYDMIRLIKCNGGNAVFAYIKYMNIGIDARALQDEKYTGIPQYLNEIIKVWMEKYPDNEYFLFSKEKIMFRIKLPENWHCVYGEGKHINGKYWMMVQLPRQIKKKKIDVFWGPNYLLPPKSKGVKYCVTVHDLAVFKFKKIGEKKNTLLLKLFAKKDSRKADAVIVDSKSTANDIEEIFKIKKSKIYVCYCGGSPRLNVNKDENGIRKILQLKQPYFLFIGTIEPRKNLTTLVKAFELYRDQYGTEEKLVLCGKRGWGCDDVYEAVECSRYRESIIMPGYISEQEKIYLLKKAKAFVFPSLYEGFGIPILEAFSYNVPVITTKVSSMPELCGEAALYIDDANNVKQLSNQMYIAMNLQESEKRAIERKMCSRLEKFTWEKCADEVMEVIYKSTIDRKSEQLCRQ